MKQKEMKKMINAGAIVGVVAMVSSGIGGSIAFNLNIQNEMFEIFNRVAVGQILGALIALIGFGIYTRTCLGNESSLIIRSGE